MTNDKWGACIPNAQGAAAGGLSTAIGQLRTLAEHLASLDERAGAAEARALATTLEPIAERVKALGPLAIKLWPVMAAKEIEANRVANEARAAREKAERLRVLSKM